MAAKFKVEVSQYIPKRDIFVITVYAKLDFSSQLSAPIVLHLKDGALCEGVLITQRSWYHEEKREKVWGLIIKSSDIQNPEEATIVSIEIP